MLGMYATLRDPKTRPSTLSGVLRAPAPDRSCAAIGEGAGSMPGGAVAAVVVVAAGLTIGSRAMRKA